MGRERDLPALVLRTTIGPMIIAHGANKVFGKGGLDGTTRWFDWLGLKPGWLHARIAAGTELTAGTLLTLGALNPLPEAAVIGLMTAAAATDHRGKGFFIFKGGWEYTGVVAAATAALAALGHGRWSIDRLLGRDRSGAKLALAATAIGVGNAALLLATSYRPKKQEPAAAATTDAATTNDAEVPATAAAAAK